MISFSEPDVSWTAIHDGDVVILQNALRAKVGNVSEKHPVKSFIQSIVQLTVEVQVHLKRFTEIDEVGCLPIELTFHTQIGHLLALTSIRIAWCNRR